MPWWRGELLQSLLELLVAPGDDHQFQRCLDAQQSLKQAFDGTDAEASRQLQDDGPVSRQAMARPGTRFGPWDG